MARSLFSGVTLRGFDSLVSESELVGKTHTSDGQRNGIPLKQGPGPKRAGHQSLKEVKGLIKGGRCGPRRDPLYAT